MSRFDLHVGIDYSGADTATKSLGNIQVYAADGGTEPQRVAPPIPRRRGWSRKQVAEHLIGLANDDTNFIAGIDHCFSVPQSYFDEHGIADWPEFLTDFVEHWPTAWPGVTVRSLVAGNQRRGDAGGLRLTEKWTGAAKSVFWFGNQGAVAWSSHAGIPWLANIREAVGGRVHFWPFDGWAVPVGKSAIVEVYPALFHRRYDLPDSVRGNDERDAYAVARWLAEADQRGILDRYLNPPLTDAERRQAEREGWILGVV